MEQYFINGAVVAIVHAILRFIDIRFISKNDKSVKDIAREFVIVYMSAVAGLYIVDNVNVSSIKKTTVAFTGKPSF